ncbi:uncharacterized protein LOC133193235 [Saccostrea echinata]|uniref:uncharacterized protein LOC133193235 n=1 Tax=Saccostrea echinata TaxID=191078 RepID=UPI002A81122E|nr:uncharacterized protein LOC133193235 [Saccostrea echinata]
MASKPNPGDRARFAKLGMAITEELTQACRDVLEMEVPPGLVYSKVKASSFYYNIRPEQEKKLICANNNGYKEFDITLIYTLIRNICTKVPLPTKLNWGGNTMPAVGEITIGDDIERIRLIRNGVFAHISSASTSQRDFDNTWSIITDICQRLQTYTKKDYMSGLNNIQRQALEEENENAVIKKLEEEYENYKSLKEMLSSLESHLKELKAVLESPSKVSFSNDLRDQVPRRNKEKPAKKSEGKTLKDEILENWMEEDVDFIPTRASAVVEEMLKHQNLVTVAGNSGSGKSALIQHIALKYKQQGWNVIPVAEVKEIRKICSPGISEKLFFVLNDPLGKDSIDVVLYNSWKMCKETLEICLKKVKLVVSCRRWVLYDKRVKGILLDESTVAEIDDEKNRMTDVEKRTILNQYTQNLKLSRKFVSEIIKTEAYFPLLCKLFSRDSEYKKGVDFFQCPYNFIKKEIEMWKKTESKKFCALILIVVFKNNLDIDAIKGNKNSMKKYKDILGMCELQESTNISVIRSTLHEMKGSYVKCVGHAFQFLHDFIMEITTLVFGVDCPQETIQYADSGFLRRRMKIEKKEKDHDPFTIYLPEVYIGDLVDRFITDIQTENVIDVLLNPCLRKESVIRCIKEKIDLPEVLPKLLLIMGCEIDKSEFLKSYRSFTLSRLGFLDLKGETCPLIGFITFCHDDISIFLLKNIIQLTTREMPIFSAICANGDSKFLEFLSQEYKETAMLEKWGILLPIHIASVFHSFSIIEELVRLGANVNMLTTDNEWTPLILAAYNDEEHLKEAGRQTEGGKRRNKTILCLLNNGAEINLCGINGVSPLYIACQNGHDSTVKILMSNGADINFYHNDGTSPLWIASQNGHDSTVQLLLSKGVDVNFCNKNGVSPLYIACAAGRDSTVKILLSNGADINLYHNDGTSPLWIACQNGHNSTVEFLLSEKMDVNFCNQNGVSPLYIACANGHDSTVQVLLSKGVDVNFCNRNVVSPLYIACAAGHDSTVKLLLSNGADINFFNDDGTSTLWIACANGHYSTVQILLHNGADMNIYHNEGASPLWIASQNGHDSTVQLLLREGVDVNFCNKNGISPLYIACENGHDSTVKILMSNGGDINLHHNDGTSPLWIASQNGYDSTVQLLLSKGVDVNFCNKNGVSPLYIACAAGRDSTVKILLSNGADTSLYPNDCVSPLWIACQNGHESTVQVLLRKGVDVNFCNQDGVSPLYIACANGHDNTVQILLRNSADININHYDGASPLWIACQNGHDSTVQVLLSKGVNVNFCNKNGVSPLYIACENGLDSTVKILLSNGADINLYHNNGTSPLWIACANGHNSTVKILLRNGADINLYNNDGASPLWIASQNGHDSTVQLLLNNAADINLCDKNGISPFHVACYKGHDTIVQHLLNKGFDVNLIDNDGASPLWMACQNGHDSTVQILLNKNASLNLCDKDGKYPLWIACQNGHESIVKLLLKNNADINSCNFNEVSPLDIARKNQHESTVKLLISENVEINSCNNNGVSFPKKARK